MAEISTTINKECEEKVDLKIHAELISTTQVTCFPSSIAGDRHCSQNCKKVAEHGDPLL